VTVHGVQEILNRFHIIEEPLQTLRESENSRDEQMQELTDILQGLGPQQETNKKWQDLQLNHQLYLNLQEETETGWEALVPGASFGRCVVQ